MAKTLNVCLFLCVVLWTNLNAQSVVKFPFKQNPPLGVSIETVYLTLVNGGLDLGADIVVTGGDGEYSYSWTYNGHVVAEQSTLHVDVQGDYFLKISDGQHCQRSVRFVVSGQTGVEAALQDLIAVYPNPTHGVVNMSFPDNRKVVQITVVSSSGKLVRVYKSIENMNDIVTIDLTGLSAGMYFVTYVFENEKTIYKSVILL